MATDTQTTTKPRTGLYRLDVDQYLRMIEGGILPHSVRVELLNGVLVRFMTKHPPHSFTVGRLETVLRSLLSENWLVREEKPVVLGRHWRPEPDISVVRGPDDRYCAQDPTVADIALFIEVSDSTYARDRGVKWRGYAAEGVPLYLIVNLAMRSVEVHTQPSGRVRGARYVESRIYGPEDTFPIVLGDQPLGMIAVTDILPRPGQSNLK